ncbi:MAG TPA: hypothetical protein VMC04_20570 [Verrucomicrobiae bacterium]|jgi:hypothetical protein|nr:hypothetical protein [Verrucomicrobiae bacterium]
MTSSGPSWRVRCSCGWEREASSAWAATALFRLHARDRSAPGTEHVITLEEPPRDAAGRP